MLEVMLLPLLTVAGGAARAPAPAAAPAADPPVRVWLNQRTFQRGDRGRVYVRTADDGYVIVLQVDPDGRARVLFPLDPTDDDFIRGQQDYEIRARGDRDAFSVDVASGTGTIYAAWSRDPFRFDGYVRGDHWDYAAFDDRSFASDPEATLTALVQAMANGRHFDYDLVTYDAMSSYASQPLYTPMYVPTFYPYPAYPVGYGGFFGCDPFWDAWCTPWYGGSGFAFAVSFGGPRFFVGYGPRFYPYFPFRHRHFGSCCFYGSVFVIGHRHRGYLPPYGYAWKPWNPGGGGVGGIPYRPRGRTTVLAFDGVHSHIGVSPAVLEQTPANGVSRGRRIPGVRADGWVQTGTAPRGVSEGTIVGRRRAVDRVGERVRDLGPAERVQPGRAAVPRSSSEPRRNGAPEVIVPRSGNDAMPRTAEPRGLVPREGGSIGGYRDDGVRTPGGGGRVITPRDGPRVYDAPGRTPRSGSPGAEPRSVVPADGPRVIRPGNDPRVVTGRDDPRVIVPREEPRAAPPRDEPRVIAPRTEPRRSDPELRPPSRGQSSPRVERGSGGSRGPTTIAAPRGRRPR